MAADGKFAERAGAGMATLHSFYDDADGLWQKHWWNSANALETTIEYLDRTGDATYAHVIDNTFEKHRAQNFIINDFNDDEGWWALAWMKAYDRSGDARHLDVAKALFEDMRSSWDDTCGGGIWWKRGPQKNPDDRKKNAIANELFLKVAAWLHLRAPRDGGPGSYLEWAQRTWTWFDASGMINGDGLINDGLNAQCENDGQATWTYNQGVILGGLVALYKATGDATLLERAKAIANATLQHLCADGVLHEPDESNLGVDGSQFKGVFMRNLGELYRITGEESYRGAILTNANAVWSRNRSSACAFGSRWVGPFDASGAAQQSSALDALNAALQFDVAGSTYQGENGVLHDLSTESTHPGFHGTGYVAGWNADGQAVDVTVAVPNAGPHDLVLRYAAVGDAVRCIRVNGAIAVQKQSFPQTGNWNTWGTTAAYDIALDAGANVVRVAFEQAQGSKGFLNLDELTVL